MDNEGKEQTRSLNTIYFYLTDGCNLRCRHCWIEPDFSPTGQQCTFIPLETMKSIITQAKPMGLTTVKLTGGEPLLHPAIHDILDYLRMEGLLGTGGTCAVCGILGIIGVLANGSYAMCGIGETIPELILDNEHRDRLEDVWLNNPMTEIEKALSIT